MALRARLAAPPTRPCEDTFHTPTVGAVSAHLFWQGDRRIDAQSYLSAGYGIRVTLEESSSPWKRLDELAAIWAPPRIKTILVAPEFGAPYLNTSQVFDSRPTPRKWLATEKTLKAETRFVRQGTILVLASASVGRSIITTEQHEHSIISHHFMRVVPRSPALTGWIYAFLRSRQGLAMMRGARYASVIRHIEPAHVGALPVPIVGDETAAEFDRITTEVLNARNRAYHLGLAAEERFARAIGAISPIPSESAFDIPATSLFSGRRRLEANYHAPRPATILQRFRSLNPDLKSLADVATKVWWMSRFRRFYGDEGMPYLSADELFTVNPQESKRILVEPNDHHERYFVQRGWIVMACSGQVYGLNGAATLITQFHEGTFFSHDLIRIVPNHESIRSGYLLTTLTHPTLGRPLLIREAYGTSIPHLDPNDVAEFPVVRLDRSVEDEIADLAEESVAERTRADVIERDLAQRASTIIDQFIARGSLKTAGV